MKTTKLLLLLLFLCLVTTVQAQIPADVKKVLDKFESVMDNPRGLELDMNIHVSMMVFSFNMTAKMYNKGEKMFMQINKKLLGQQILIENGFDGTQEWSYEKFGKEPDSLIIKKVSKKSKGDFDLNLNVDKDYKSAKMKVVKNRYYEITFTDPLTKDMPKKTVISIDKNNFYLHEMEMKEGSGKMRITVNHITVGVPDNVFVLDLKKYPTAKVVRK